jgi:hypothetical protein
VSRVHIIFDRTGEVDAYDLAPSAEWARACWQAMMLAPSLEVCAALLRGESVPLNALDGEWAARFGKRSE